ncbi:uncharacterized protein ISCGN_020502 [Ixodes scapularis]
MITAEILRPSEAASSTISDSSETSPSERTLKRPEQVLSRFLLASCGFRDYMFSDSWKHCGGSRPLNTPTFCLSSCLLNELNSIRHLNVVKADVLYSAPTLLDPPFRDIFFIATSEEAAAFPNLEVVLENQARAVITTRSVLIRPKGRCVCYLDCQCTCMGESVVCRPETAVNRNKRRTMAQTEARAVVARLSHPRVTHPSRFYDIPVPLHGSPPGNPGFGNPGTGVPDSDDPDSGVVSCGLSIALSALEVFVSIGLLKAVIGLASQPVALWGLRNFVSQLETTIWLSEQAKSGDGEKTKRSERCRVGPLVLFCMNLFCCCMLPLVLCGVAEDMSRRRTKDGQEERSKAISPVKAGLATSKV